MKFLLTAINAKYIHSNPGVYSLKMFAESKGAAQAVQGDQNPWEDGLPCVPLEKQEEHGPYAGVTEKTARESHSMQVEIAEYTINNQMELILEDIYRRKPDMVGISCYIWNIAYALDLVRDIHKVLPDTDIWLGGPEVCSRHFWNATGRWAARCGAWGGTSRRTWRLRAWQIPAGCRNCRTGQRLPGYRKYQATHGYQLSGTACPRWRG